MAMPAWGAPGVSVELLQRAGQSVGVSGDVSPGGVRLVFPGPGNGQLDEGSRNGSENEHENPTAAQAAAAAVSTAAAEHGRKYAPAV